MTSLSEITLGFQNDGETPLAVIGADAVGSVAEVMARVPELADPKEAAELARVMTHFARGRAYRVVTDCQAFEETYRTRIKSENPAEPFQQDVHRLIDHGIPDFADVTKPALEDGHLTWCAEDATTGLPYRVRATINRPDEPDFQPLSLTPLPVPPVRAPADPVPEAAATAAPAPQSEIPLTGLPDWLDDKDAEPDEPETPEPPPPPPV